MPRVSVVMPSYNHEKFVAEAIQSVLAQTYQDFEIVITDDGSTDGTVAEIKKFTDPRIRLFVLENNQGACVAANNCVKAARGEFVAMLSSDDVFLPDKLQKQIKVLDEHPAIAAVFGYARIINEDGTDFTDENHFYCNIFNQPNRTRFEWLNYFFYNTNCLCHPSVLIRRKCYDAVGLYDPRYAQLPDFDFWIRLCMKHEIHIIPENLIKFRVLRGETNASAPTSKEAVTRHLWEISAILKNFFKINTVDDFRKVFPEVSQIKGGEDIEDDSIAFFLSLLALETESLIHKDFALRTLHELLGDKDIANNLKIRHGFTYNSFIKLTSKLNIYSVEMEYRHQLAERDRQLFELHNSINEMSNSLSWKVTYPLRAVYGKYISLKK